MKTVLVLLVVSSMFLGNSMAYAAFNSGSTGALGAFNPSVNTEVVLPEPDGVLNYTTVNIPAGVTVTFRKNSKNTPVYMLSSGDVVIAGTISVNGTNGSANDIGTGGPSGFNGGYGGQISSAGGSGIGPGGGSGGWVDNVYGTGGGGGGFGTVGTNGANGYNGRDVLGGKAYGNAKLLPIIGGSGGGGGGGRAGAIGCGGGGGGGAILIASSGIISITGQVTAKGGNASSCTDAGGGGSGGSIKLMANTTSGNGTISAIGGNGYDKGGAGGKGWIRIESFVNTRSAATDPPYLYGTPGSVFVSNIPSLSIISVADMPSPATPTGNYNQPDITLLSTTTNPVTVNVSATNIPDGTTVTVWVIPQYGSPTSVNTILSGSTASANVSLSTTYSNVITAQATFTVTAMFYNGEEIDKVRVAATLGGKSETTYITKSGKEIKGELLAALMK